MGMKVAAVSVMCQDERIFEAMMNAGTPCPYDGMIGDDAKAAWTADQASKPTVGRSKILKDMDTDDKSTIKGLGAVGGIFLLLLL